MIIEAQLKVFGELRLFFINNEYELSCILSKPNHIPGGPIKTEQSIFQDFFFTLLDRASFPHYNNTKIIKFGWELFILWTISYGLSFSGFARFPEFRGTINDKSMANPENDSP